MVTDQELARYVENLLRQSTTTDSGGGGGATAATVSTDAVVRQLESQLGLDLSHKAAFIRDQIRLLLSPLPAKDSFSPPPFPQFHPYPQFAASPYASLPSHHDISFRYQPSLPSPPPVSPASGPQLQQQQLAASMAAAAAAEPPRAVVPPQKESASTGVKRRGGPGGLNKVCGVSPELQVIVGEPTMARTEIVKQLWAYIRRNNLQDPNNKRKIICNDELRLVFETDCTDMFKMNKLLAKHIIPLGSTKQAGPDAKKLKPAATEVVPSVEADIDRFPVVVSDALANFFGTGERAMIQSEAVRRVWDHIKSNKLEDPMNPMVILCDSKLKQLFGCESLSAIGVSEMLSHHLFKQS